jgi:hypothetical protein
MAAGITLTILVASDAVYGGPRIPGVSWKNSTDDECHRKTSKSPTTTQQKTSDFFIVILKYFQWVLTVAYDAHLARESFVVLGTTFPLEIR